MRRRTNSLGFSVTVSTVNTGAASPRAAKASSRIAIMRPVRLWVLATVKSHANCSSSRWHAGRGEIGEDAFHRRPARFERRVGGALPVAVGDELAANGAIGWPAAFDQMAQPDDDAMAVGEVDQRVDHEQRRLVLIGDGIELRPERMPLAGRRIEQDDR